MKRVGPQKVQRRSRDGKRLVVVVLALGSVLALGLFATDEYATAPQQAPLAVTAATGQSKGQVYTGSILYMPNNGNVCHQLFFDNHTGTFTDNGNVDCERAYDLDASGAPKEWSSDRVRVISSGFRGH